MEHTKEPWKLEEGPKTSQILADEYTTAIKDDAGNYIALLVPCYMGQEAAEVDFSRIVQCVNACAEVKDPGKAMELLRLANLDWCRPTSTDAEIDFQKDMDKIAELFEDNEISSRP